MNAYETASLFVIANTGIFSWFSDDDWKRLQGPNGGFVFSIIVVAGLSFFSWRRIRKDDERARLDREDRESRHKEAMDIQRALMKQLQDKDEKLMGLTVEQLKAQGMATRAIERMDSNIQRLTIQLSEMPCKTSLQFNSPMPAP